MRSASENYYLTTKFETKKSIFLETELVKMVGVFW